MPDAEDRAKPTAVEGQLGEVAPAEQALDGEIAPDLPVGEDRRLIASREFSGPLPLPDVLGEYDQVKPGLADIIVEQWQSETRHRHKTIDGVRETDHEAMRSYYAGERRGQWIGLVAFLAIVTVAILAVLKGSDVAALGSLFVAGSYAVWALRRSSSPATPPTDLDMGDEVEKLPVDGSE